MESMPQCNGIGNVGFAEGFDSTLSHRSQLSQMLGRDVPIIMLTDSQSLFNVMTTQSARLKVV
jgi:hypothetical protein